MAEEKAQGLEMGKTWGRYLRRGYGLGCNLLLLSFVLCPAVLIVLFRLFITRWVSAPFAQQSASHWLRELAVFTAATLLSGGVASVLVAAVFLKAGSAVHDAMLERIARAPMSFFVSHPVGRLLTRFSKDMAVADNVLVKQLIQISQFLLNACAFAFLAFWVFPALLLPFPLLVLAAFGLVSLTKTAIVDSLRYDALSRSPINSLLAASLASLPTIRAFNRSQDLRRHFEGTLVETSGRAYFSYQSFASWLGFYLDWLCVLLILGCLLAAFVAPTTSPSLVALALASIQQVLSGFSYSVRIVMESCSSLANVERLHEFTQLPQ